MSQPYPGPYPGSQQLVVTSQPKYRGVRRVALVSIVLMGLTAAVAVVQTLVLWTSYDEVKRFVYGLLSEDELDRGLESIVGAGPLLDLVGYLLPATGIAFLIWLWQARENTDVLHAPSPGGYGGPHRHAQGWVIGSWVCPIVQFWYPLQVVEDVVWASEPPTQPGAARSGGIRALLYTWWGAWTAFWVLLVGGGAAAVISFVSWVLRLVDRADAADATGDYVDIYDLQDFLVRVALAVNIGFTIATVLLIVAGAAVTVLLLRVTSWQDDRAAAAGAPLGPTIPGHSPSHLPPPGSQYQRPQDGPPQYAPRPAFPTYSPRQTYGPETYGGTPNHPTYAPGAYQGTTGSLTPPSQASVAPQTPGPHPPGGYGGSIGSGPNRSRPPTPPAPPRADHPTDPEPTTGPEEAPRPRGASPWHPPE